MEDYPGAAAPTLSALFLDAMAAVDAHFISIGGCACQRLQARREASAGAIADAARIMPLDDSRVAAAISERRRFDIRMMANARSAAYAALRRYGILGLLRLYPVITTCFSSLISRLLLSFDGRRSSIRRRVTSLHFDVAFSSKGFIYASSMFFQPSYSATGRHL